MNKLGIAARLGGAANQLGLIRRSDARVTSDAVAGVFFEGLNLRPPREGGNVVLLADDGDRAVGRLVSYFKHARVHVLSPSALPEWNLERHGAVHVRASTLGQMHQVLKRIGPPDVIVCAVDVEGATHLDVLRRLVFHLSPEGVMLFRRSVIPRDGWDQLITALRRTDAMAAEGGGAKSPLSEAIASVAMDRDALVVVKRNRHWLKLRNEEAGRALPGRHEDVNTELLKMVPAGQFESRADLHLHEASIELPNFPKVMKYPALFAREYCGDLTVASHSLLFGPSAILPESFRYQQVQRLINGRLVDTSQDFAIVPPHLAARRSLPGVFFHLDSPYSGHFGHVMSEVVSRLWGWQVAKDANPDLKALFRIYRGTRVPDLEIELFKAYGIAEDDIVWVDEPVRVSHVIGATPMWQNQHPHYVHPQIEETWKRLSRGLAGCDGVAERIFVSRAPGLQNRACRNVGEIEQFFESKGFKIIYPEHLTLADQAAVFGGAKIIAGLAGSAMFNVLFARSLERLVILSHEAYTARNEYLYASVLGCETHYVWSEPDVHHPKGGWSDEAFQSAWQFDFHRNRKVLEQIVS